MSIARYLLVFLFLLAATPTISSNAIEVKDDTGNVLWLSQPAKRIISLAPHLTELLFELGVGDQVVGAIEHSNFPPAASAVPRIGSHSKFDIETITSLTPDLILAWHSGTPRAEISRLEKLRVPIFRSEPRQLDDIANTLIRLGQLTGAGVRGKRLAATFRADVSRLKVRYKHRPSVRVFFQVWQDPLITLNRDHLVTTLISQCGGENIFGALGPLAPTVSLEAVIGTDPEVIVAAAPQETAHQWLRRWRRWQGIQAVRNEHLFSINPDVINRATPRILEGMQSLCELIERARARN